MLAYRLGSDAQIPDDDFLFKYLGRTCCFETGRMVHWHRRVLWQRTKSVWLMYHGAITPRVQRSPNCKVMVIVERALCTVSTVYCVYPLHLHCEKALCTHYTYSTPGNSGKGILCYYATVRLNRLFRVL